jgi:hypothetical protein
MDEQRVGVSLGRRVAASVCAQSGRGSQVLSARSRSPGRSGRRGCVGQRGVRGRERRGGEGEVQGAAAVASREAREAATCQGEGDGAARVGRVADGPHGPARLG